MAVSIAGIIINVIMLLIIIVLVVMGNIYSNDLTKCEQEQSPFCYTIQCPCDDLTSANTPAPPCFGYAQMDAGNGNFRCSIAPYQVVDSKGNPV